MQTRTAVLALGLALGLGLAPSALAQLTEDYRFKGEVADTKGTPLADVTITLRNVKSGGKIVFKTKDDGTFDRRMIPHAVYDATFEKEGYEPYNKQFDWSPMAATTITQQVKVVLEGAGERQARELQQAQVELGKKSAKLYEDAYTALTAGDCATAESKARELLEIGAGSFEYAVRFVLGRCLATRGEVEPALAEYRKVVELKPDLFEAQFDLAALLDRSGKPDEALAAYERAAALKAGDADVEFAIGRILFTQGKHEQALVHLSRAVETNPAHSQACKALGFTYLSIEKKDLAKALEFLKKYLELEPTAPDKAQVSQIIKELQ